MELSQDKVVQILEQVKDELSEPVDNSSVIADWTHKLFNQGVSLAISTAILKIRTQGGISE